MKVVFSMDYSRVREYLSIVTETPTKDRLKREPETGMADTLRQKAGLSSSALGRAG